MMAFEVGRKLEVCVDNFDSATIAFRAGADRLELCQDLSVGGLTPTAGFIKIVKTLVSCPVYVLIRPHARSFNYSPLEIDQMVEDIKISKKMGADGFVFGALDRDGNVDLETCQLLLAAASGRPVTFHRAFDQIQNKEKALEDLIKLGFKRLLTSGVSGGNAVDGVYTLQELISQAKLRIIIMPAGGVSVDNILSILRITHSDQYHSSGRMYDHNSPTKKSSICSEEIIRGMKSLLKTCIH